MTDKIPEEYFCPKCNYKMMKDMVFRMQHNQEHPEYELPTLSVVMMGINMIGEAGCPTNLLKPIYEWAKEHNNDKYELSTTEQDKLKLIKWQEWARS